MGESKATARIRRVMTKLRMEGKLDPPKSRRKEPPRCPTCGVVTKRASGYCAKCEKTCCWYRMTSRPDYFRRCPDCPLPPRLVQ